MLRITKRPNLTLANEGKCLAKHGLPSFVFKRNKRCMKRKANESRIPFLLRYFLSLQNHAPQILETACRIKIYDHNVYVATTGVQPQMLVMVMNKKKNKGDTGTTSPHHPLED
jgi:hypothetical protein